MLKKLSTYGIAVLTCFLINPHAVASQSKVRMATNLLAKAGQATLAAAKANKFPTAVLASTIALAGYTKYRHGWYDRELAPLEKLQRQRKAYRHNTVKSSLSTNENHGHCPPSIAHLINDYAGSDEKDLKIEAQIKRIKAAAAAAKEVTLKNYLIGLRTGRIRLSFTPFLINTFSVMIPASWLAGPLCSIPLIRLIEFVVYKLLCRQMLLYEIDSSPISWIPDASWNQRAFTDKLVQINNWRDVFEYNATEAKQMLSFFPFFFGICAACATVANTKAWLDERDYQARRAAWIEDHQG
jgi:hypothetical protein